MYGRSSTCAWPRTRPPFGIFESETYEMIVSATSPSGSAPSNSFQSGETLASLFTRSAVSRHCCALRYTSGDIKHPGAACTVVLSPTWCYDTIGRGVKSPSMGRPVAAPSSSVPAPSPRPAAAGRAHTKTAARLDQFRGWHHHRSSGKRPATAPTSSCQGSRPSRGEGSVPGKGWACALPRSVARTKRTSLRTQNRCR